MINNWVKNQTSRSIATSILKNLLKSENTLLFISIEQLIVIYENHIKQNKFKIIDIL